MVPTAWREAIYTAGYLPCRKQARCGHKLSRCGRTARIADDQGGGLAEAGRAAWGSLGHALALRAASGAPAGRRLSQLGFDTGYLGLAPLICAKLMRQKGWEESFFASAVLSSCVAGVIANVATRSGRMLKAVRADSPTHKSRTQLPRRPRPVPAPKKNAAPRLAAIEACAC